MNFSQRDRNAQKFFLAKRTHLNRDGARLLIGRKVGLARRFQTDTHHRPVLTRVKDRPQALDREDIRIGQVFDGKRAEACDTNLYVAEFLKEGFPARQLLERTPAFEFELALSPDQGPVWKGNL